MHYHRKLKVVVLAGFLAVGSMMFAQQTSAGGVTTSGGMSEGHEGGSVFTQHVSDSLSLGDSVSIHRRLRMLVSESLATVDAVSASHHVPVADSLRLSDNVTVDYIASYRPTTYLDSGSDQSGNPSPCSNDGNAFDGNPATAAVCISTYSPSGPTFTQKSVTYSGFPAKQGSPSTVKLNVISSSAVNSKCSSYSIGMQYSLNNGSSWTAVPGQTGVYAQNTATIAVSSTQDFTQMQVRGSARCTGASSPVGSATLSMNEIWIFAE